MGRPSRRAVVRSQVRRVPVADEVLAVGPVAEPGVALEAPPVMLAGVCEVLRLPCGDRAEASYRVTLDVLSGRPEPVTLDVVGLEVDDTAVRTSWRQPVVSPGAQQLTLVVGGKVDEGTLTLRYELDGQRHQVSASLPRRSA